MYEERLCKPEVLATYYAANKSTFTFRRPLQQSHKTRLPLSPGPENPRGHFVAAGNVLSVIYKDPRHATAATTSLASRRPGDDQGLRSRGGAASDIGRLDRSAWAVGSAAGCKAVLYLCR